jgi:hypothetical protein
MPPEPVHDVARSPIRATFAEYIATLTLWEGDLLVYVSEYYCPKSSLYELLQQRNVKILIAAMAATRITTAPLVVFTVAIASFKFIF